MKDTDPKQDSDLDTNQKLRIREEKPGSLDLRQRLANDCSVQTSLLYYMNLTVKNTVADSDPHWEYGSESRRAKIIHKSEENSSFEVPDVLF
jgi:hypothetical protein